MLDQKITKTSRFKCDKCNGTGFILRTTEQGYEVANECECLKEQIKTRRLAFADIPEVFQDITLNSFDTSLYKTPDGREMAKIAKKLCSSFIRDYEEMLKRGKGLYLFSSTKGSGKTRMAVSIANALINYKNTPVKFTTTIRILEEIKATFNNPEISESELLSAINRVEVIIFDDIGTENPTPWVREKFYSILNQRLIDRKITIFTSNCKVEKLQLDSRIVNRIQKMAIPIQFPEESVRGYLAEEENNEIMEMLLR